MCHYCGCRQVPLIRDYIAEHESITTLGMRMTKLMGHGDVAAAQALVPEFAAMLDRHWQGEEEGVFVAMAAADEMYADYIAPLVAEHRDLAAFLAGADLADPEDARRFAAEIVALADHIEREEDGLFPATLVTLDGPDWDAAFDAWHRAHPGEELIAD